MYLAKEGNPNSDAYAKLDLPASPWELWDALDKVRLQKEDILYMEIEDYFAFEYLDGLDISLNELNDLAAQLAALDEVQEVAFDGFLRMEVQNKVDTNGGVITLQDLRDLAVSAKTDCYHVVDNRTNVVVTRQEMEIPGCRVAHSLEEAVALFPAEEEVFVIGGAQIYAQALPLAGRFYLTRVFHAYEGDTHFPAWNDAEWRLVSSESFASGANYPYPFAFETYERRRN